MDWNAVADNYASHEEVDPALEIERKQREAFLKELHPISFAQLDAEIRKWLLVEDTCIVKLLPALITANRLEGRDAIWVQLIGPSGAGKTELLNSLLDLHDIYSLSLITQNTFLSGMPGRGDSSLLPKLTGKILLFKDWTTILSQNRDARNEIMGQLREIYDGHMKKIFGTGKTREWKGKVGLIAGVTGAIDMAQQMHAALGERFIFYRLVMPDRKEVAWRAIQNTNKQNEMRMAIRNAMYAFLKGIQIPDEIPQLPEHVQREIVSLANFSTMARSGVIRDLGMNKEVIFVPTPEMPTRIVQQLATIASALIINNGMVFNDDDMKIIYKIALDCIPQTNKMVIREMAKENEQETAKIATALGYPTGPIRIYLENLALLGVCTRIKGSDSLTGGGSDKWTLHPEFMEIMSKYERIRQEEIEIEGIVLPEEDIPTEEKVDEPLLPDEDRAAFYRS